MLDAVGAVTDGAPPRLLDRRQRRAGGGCNAEPVAAATPGRWRRCRDRLGGCH